MVILYTDGGCSGNDQRDLLKRKMVMVVADHHGVVLAEQHESGGSNNIAELTAILWALRLCAEEKIAAVTIRTDSRNNFAWIYGKKLGKKLNDREAVLTLQREIRQLLTTITLTLEWIPREHNLAGHFIEQRYGL